MKRFFYAHSENFVVIIPIIVIAFLIWGTIGCSDSRNVKSDESTKAYTEVCGESITTKTHIYSTSSRSDLCNYVDNAYRKYGNGIVNVSFATNHNFHSVMITVKVKYN